MKILDLFYPPKCIFCRRLLSLDERDICTPCRMDLPICGGPLNIAGSTVAAAFYYEGSVRDSLLRFKFHGYAHYAQSYGPLTAASALGALPMDRIDAVTWIPISRRRKWKRGYDQAKLLAQSVGKALGKPVERSLAKWRNTPPQSTLKSFADRQSNVRGVYRPLNKARISGKTFLLIDDILTTGSTVSEAARVLLAAGASEVYFAVLARARR